MERKNTKLMDREIRIKPLMVALMALVVTGFLITSSATNPYVIAGAAVATIVSLLTVCILAVINDRW